MGLEATFAVDKQLDKNKSWKDFRDFSFHGDIENSGHSDEPV